MWNAFTEWKITAYPNDSCNVNSLNKSKSRGKTRRGGEGVFDGNKNARRISESFCSKNYLSFHAMQLIEQVREQFLDLLIDIGFLPGRVS